MQCLAPGKTELQSSVQARICMAGSKGPVAQCKGPGSSGGQEVDHVSAGYHYSKEVYGPCGSVTTQDIL